MSTYKITNITNTLGKREIMFNSPINIEYVDEMMKKTVPVQAGGVLYLTVPSLPLSIHRLRVKNFVTVVEVSEDELIKSKITPMFIAPTPVATEEESHEETLKKAAKKKAIKKDIEE